MDNQQAEPSVEQLLAKILELQIEAAFYRAHAEKMAAKLQEGTKTLENVGQTLDLQQEAIDTLLTLRRWAAVPHDN